MATQTHETENKLPSLNRPHVDAMPGLLSEIGMLAAGQGRSQQTEAIFKAVEALRPESDVPFIGKALSLMNSGETERAVDYLRSAGLEKHPKSEGILCVLALALALKGDKHASQEIVDSIMKNSKTQWARNLAESLGKPS